MSLLLIRITLERCQKYIALLITQYNITPQLPSQTIDQYRRIITSRMCSITPRARSRVSQEPSLTVSKASSLLRNSSLQFQKIYNRHRHLKAKLQQKHRKMKYQESQKQRMNTILHQKQEQKSALNSYIDNSDKLLQDQTNANTQLRFRLQQSIKSSQQQKLNQNQQRFIVMKQQMKQNHMKKKLIKQSHQIDNYMKRKQLYDDYYQKIESTGAKNSRYRESVRNENKKNVAQMMDQKKELDTRVKKFKKLGVTLQQKIKKLGEGGEQ